MKALVTILSLVTISLSAVANGGSLKCSVKIAGSEQKSEIVVQANRGLAPIGLGDGKTLRIVFFNDDIRFTEIRPLTDAERAEANKDPGAPHIEGKIVAYSKVTANSDVSSAVFITPDVEVRCDIAE